MEGVNAGVNSIGPREFVGIGESENYVVDYQLVGEVEMGGGGELQPVVPAGKVMEKRKPRRPSKGQGPKLPTAKKIKLEEDDVCFICLNGGDLVLCDRRCCPKAYHLACIKQDESFLSSKHKWICGWHICSNCLKDAHYMCYTCTYSLCKTCIKNAEYVSVRENYGFCSTCLKIIMLIENQDEEIKDTIQVDFDDPSSWEYLFKLYWNLLKNNLSLTLNELKQAQNPWGGVVGSDFMPRLSDDSSREQRSEPEIVNRVSLNTESCDKSTIVDIYSDWASRELMEFIGYIKNGDTTIMSRIEVQLLLLEYIKSNNLHDPHLKSQIICDEKLKNLFGKAFVGHVEMLKLLEYHFIIMKKEDIIKKKARNESRLKEEDRTPQTFFDDYAAIDVHNINLIFLRRSLIERLLSEVENFHDQVVGSIVRISVSDDMHRLVQVVGTSKGSEPYRISNTNTTTNIMLEVLNLTKKESMSIEAISDEEFSEDECKRLRQSIKFGLMKRLAVEEIQMKANALQAMKFDDWLAAEILRLNFLRDQAKEKGHIKEVKECTDNLKILKIPEERQKRLSEFPDVHADPKMNPIYDSEDDNNADEGSKLRYPMLNFNAKKGGAGKGDEEEPINDQVLQENINGGGSSVSKNEAMSSFASETAMADSPVIVNSIETDEIWLYRDPTGKIQGPFCFKQLRTWSSYFPADMMIWNNDERYDSVLLTNAINGKFNKISQMLHTDIDNDFNAASIEHDESVILEIRADDMKSSIIEDIGISDLLSQRLETRDDVLIAEKEQNEPSEIRVEGLGCSREPESDKNLMATPNSNQNVSCWQELNERIEFNTLADESVSDLLAEIEAMEFRNELSSPTRVIQDPRKNDAFSSTSDFPFPNLEAVMDDLFGNNSDAFIPPAKRSGQHSTTSSLGDGGGPPLME